MSTLRFHHGLAGALVLTIVGLGACQREPATPAADEKIAAAAATSENLIDHGSFEEWPSGGGVRLPTGWRGVEAPNSPSISYTRDAGDVKDGTTALRITSDPDVVSLWNETVPITGIQNPDLRGQTVTAGVWARADTPTAAFLNIRDGVGESAVVDHPGDGTWRFLTVTYTLADNAAGARVRVGNRKQDGRSVVLFDGAVLVKGSSIVPASE